jgi:quercetin dioxygenase-like cupin family protein
MHCSFKPIRLLPLVAAALAAVTSLASAQDKPVTPPDSYRVVMENERVRMIEVHVKPHSKVNVESPPNRERFLYMLSDGALILAPPGKTPYEFALHAGETAVFPAVSPTVENDTDSAVRALMVEVKQPMRTEVASKTRGKGKYAKGKSRTRVAAKSAGKTRHASASRKPSADAAKTKPPLNLSKANAKSKKVSGKGKGASS